MPCVFKSKRFPPGIFLVTLSALLLVGCRGSAEPATPVNDAPAPTAAPTPTSAPDRTVLVRRSDSDPNLAAQADSVLRELAAGSGLEFEIRENLINNEVTPDMKVVVFLERPENLGSLAAGAPGTQFVAITRDDWNPTGNISVIRLREENTAFMAGYIAAMLAPNYRVGALLAAEKASVNLAFVNGVYFYCGNCAAQIYPLNTYPITAAQPVGSPSANWQASFDQINSSNVNVLYIAGEAYSPELFTYLASQDVALIGSQSPLETGREKWAATIFADGVSPIRDIWPDLMAGSGGQALNAAINIADSMFIGVREGLVWLSEGKFQYAQRTMQLMQDGKINPLPVN